MGKIRQAEFSSVLLKWNKQKCHFNFGSDSDNSWKLLTLLQLWSWTMTTLGSVGPVSHPVALPDLTVVLRKETCLDINTKTTMWILVQRLNSKLTKYIHSSSALKGALRRFGEVKTSYEQIKTGWNYVVL